MIDVYCVNVGTKYTRDFDEKLKDSVAEHLTLEHNFTCLTDRPEKEYDKPVTHPELRGVFHKLSLLQFTGQCLFFDLDIAINDNIDFLTNDFEGLTLVNSSAWKQESLKTHLFGGPPRLSAIVLGAMIINLALGCLAGTLVPLLLVRLRQDPAQVSSILLTFITDTGGFFIFLSLGSWFLL